MDTDRPEVSNQERELDECRRLLEHHKSIRNLLFEASSDGLAVLSADGKFIQVNRAYERIMGQTRYELLGNTARNVSLATGYQGPRLPTRYCPADSPPALLNINGDNVFLTVHPDLDSTGTVRHMIIKVRNLSHLNHLKDQLERHGFGVGQEEFQASELKEVLKAAGLGEIVIASAMMEKVFAAALRIARHDATVMLSGETGTGKGVVAKLIHRLSERANRPFVDLNCGAIPEALVESELFGYQPGAFTGSLKGGKKGQLEMAHRGTLFLDEIGELPLRSQVKLLKFLDDKVIVPLGGSFPKAVDVRLIAATNASLPELVRAGKFRQDLFYRLEVVPLSIPPLRQRREEIVPLAEYFLERFNQEFGEERTFSPDVLELLGACDFPGNVRELKNLVARLVVSAHAQEIRVEDLPETVRRASRPLRDGCSCNLAGDAAEVVHPKARLSLRKRFEDDERMILQRYARHCRSAREIARRTGLHHSVVLRKLRRYQISLSRNGAAEHDREVSSLSGGA